MERALFADVVMDLDVLQKYCRAVGDASSRTDGQPARFQRLYAGSEFCVNRLPGVVRTRTIVELCRDFGLRLTFVLPPCYDTSLDMTQRLIGLLEPGTEVVVNDWGVLQAVVDAGCLPVFGRALNRLIRDPRLDVTGHTQAQIDYYQTSQIHIPAVQDFIKQAGFVRVELDNVRQGLGGLPAGALPCSLYTPWTLISVSRFCGPDYAIECPGRPCFESRTFVEGIPIVADGTATFWFHAGMPENLDRLPIDRLVHVTGPEGLTWLLDEITHPAWDEVDLRRLQARREVVVGDSAERIVLESLSPEYKSVLQIGCGFGAHLEILDRAGKQLVGLDSSLTVLDIARRRVPSADLIDGTIIDGTISPPVDLILDLHCMNDTEAESRQEYAQNVVNSLNENGLYLLYVLKEAAPTAENTESDPVNPQPGITAEELERHFQQLLSFVWQHDLPADKDNPAKSLILLRKGPSDPAFEKLIAARIGEFLNKGFDSHDVEFVDLTADVPDGDATSPAWLDTTACASLRQLGFQYAWREFEGEGRTFFRLTHPDFKLELEFSPVAQNRPHYRNIGEYNVAYHGEVQDLALLDATIDVLTGTLY
jgi:hypothetical protein